MFYVLTHIIPSLWVRLGVECISSFYHDEDSVSSSAPLSPRPFPFSHTAETDRSPGEHFTTSSMTWVPILSLPWPVLAACFPAVCSSGIACREKTTVPLLG